MSKNENSNNNAFIIASAVIVVAALLAFFTFSGSDTITNDVADNGTDASDKSIPVEKVIKTDKPEEIVVISESVEDIKDAAKKATLAEKANEAAIRNQVNEDVKNSEDTDFGTAE